MKPNGDITDRARSDDFTALVMQVADDCDLSGVMCVRRIDPSFTDGEGVFYPPSVAYECRRRVAGRFCLQTLTFDIEAAQMGNVYDLIAMELEAVFG